MKVEFLKLVLTKVLNNVNNLKKLYEKEQYANKLNTISNHSYYGFNDMLAEKLKQLTTDAKILKQQISKL